MINCMIFGHDYHHHGSYIEALTLPNGEPNYWRRRYHQILRCANCGHTSTAWQDEGIAGGVWVRCDLRRADEDAEDYDYTGSND